MTKNIGKSIKTRLLNRLFCNLVEKDSLDERIPLVSVVL